MIAQLPLDLPVPPRPEPDFEGNARRELGEALALAKAARDRPPWHYRRHRYWGVVFPQMADWLPEAEREPMVAEFKAEWDRIDGLYDEGEKKL